VGETRTSHTAEKLLGERLDMIARERSKIVLLEKVIDTHAEQLGHQAYVIPIVKPIQNVNAFTKKGKHQSGVLRTRDRVGTRTADCWGHVP
jgi:hypothetical protein